MSDYPNQNNLALDQAISAIRNGHRATAARLLAQIISNEPDNKKAWYWYAHSLPNFEKKRFCLEKALTIDPGFQPALQALDQMHSSSDTRAEIPPGKPEPIQLPEPRRTPPKNSGKAKKQGQRKARASGGCLPLFFVLVLGISAGIWVNSRYVLPIPQSIRTSVLSYLPIQLQPLKPTAANRINTPVPVQSTQEAISIVIETPAPDMQAGESIDQSAAVMDVPVSVNANVDSKPEMITIGHSVAGQPLEVFRFGSGKDELMIIAGVHGGNEWNTIALADQLIVHLTSHPELIPADKTLFILRDLNPDGEARAHTVDGRVNENGVDLNRNWNDHWVADWPREGCWSFRAVTAGTAPFSEPETQALRDFILSHHIKALINYHSAALGVFAGGLPPETNSVNLAIAIHKVSTYTYPPVDTGCRYRGQLADWAAKRKIAAVDLELTNHTDTDFDQNLKVVDTLLHFTPIGSTTVAADGKNPASAKGLSSVPAQLVVTFWDNFYSAWMTGMVKAQGWWLRQSIEK